ncbi:MAG: hypothetical protein DRR42_23930 [Gammaproteobacteria bacterium]|nr:MAG: hypothetical protein DRR42_23930 [Gammaproteobacteria bacterium]
MFPRFILVSPVLWWSWLIWGIALLVLCVQAFITEKQLSGVFLAFIDDHPMLYLEKRKYSPQLYSYRAAARI